MRPRIELAQHWSFPLPRIRTLGGGLTAWVYHLPGQHVAAFDLVLPVPLAAEPRDREGVATVALNSIDEGTTTHPDGRIAELLELQGASLHGTAAHGHTRLGGDAPAGRLPRVTELLADVLAHPAYSPQDVAHHVDLQVAAYDSRQASPGAVAKAAFRAALFGGATRDGRPSSGTPETLTAITRDDVAAWHRDHWNARGATFVLAGDLSSVDPDATLAPLAAWAASGRAGQQVERPEAGSAAPRIVIADLPDAVQATVQVGTLTPGRHHPHWAALKLGVHAMVGAFASRLNLELRERRGYTYGVGGGLGARRTDGQLSLGGSFRTDVAAESVALMLEGLVLADPFTAEEVDDARRFLLGVAPLANETASDIVRQAAVLAAADEDPGFVNEHFAALEVPDAGQVTEAFRAHVRPSDLTIALSGPAADLQPALRARGLDAEVVTGREG